LKPISPSKPLLLTVSSLVYFEAILWCVFYNQDRITKFLVGNIIEKAKDYFSNDGKLNLNISCSPKYMETQKHLHGKR